MQYIVISDSHGRKGAIEEVLYRHPNRDVIFLGDGIRDIEELERSYPVSFIRVQGNNDFLAIGTQKSIILPVGSKRLFLTHGHEYGARGGIDTLIYTARLNGCDGVLYGHTHIQTTGERDGVFYLNPGAIGFLGDYALLTEKNGILTAELKKL